MLQVKEKMVLNIMATVDVLIALPPPDGGDGGGEGSENNGTAPEKPAPVSIEPTTFTMTCMALTTVTSNSDQLSDSAKVREGSIHFFNSITQFFSDYDNSTSK